MSRLIITGASVFTNDPIRPFWEAGSVLIDDGIILDIGDAEDIRKKYPEVGEEKLGPGIITPGLVNLHHHLYSSLARGWIPQGAPPADFPQVLERIWWRLDKALKHDDIYLSAIVGLSESVRSGVTSVIDHHASQQCIIGSLEQVARAYDEVGLNGSICFELTDREGKKAFDSGLRETVSALQKWPEFTNSVRLKAMVGLHASMTLSNESLKEISEATSFFNAGYHFHLAEDKSDQTEALGKYGVRAARRFAEYGMLGENCLAIHGVHLNDEEIDLLKGTGTNLILCPRSNQNNAVGIPEWWKYNGVNLGLGTDGIGSDMIGEAKAALYISHHDSHNPSFGFPDIVNLLFNNNPMIFEKVAGYRVGKISSGYPADLVYWRYDSPTPINEDNIGGHYLYGLYNHQADIVWIGGDKIFSNGNFLKLNYGDLMARARKAAANLWERI
jgi:putative selenium metabolism protein SsnA